MTRQYQKYQTIEILKAKLSINLYQMKNVKLRLCLGNNLLFLVINGTLWLYLHNGTAHTGWWVVGGGRIPQENLYLNVISWWAADSHTITLWVIWLHLLDAIEPAAHVANSNSILFLFDPQAGKMCVFVESS